MNDFTHEPTSDGAEVIEPEQIDIGTLAVLNKSEIDQQVATARKWPRSVKRFRDEALQLATLDEATAGECIYALPRDGKTIEGPSARFAEIVAYAWTNSRAGARVVSEDSEFVTSQGIYYDLEKNSAISYEVKRRITNKSGKRYSADMIATTSNAASSIALRNAILKGVPKAIWKPIYDAVRKVIAGDFKTLVNRRKAALQAFVIYGVNPEMIFRALGVGGEEDIGLEQLVTLHGILTALKEGDTTVEETFGNNEALRKSDATRTATERTVSDINRKYSGGNGSQSAPPAATADDAKAEIEKANQTMADAQKRANASGEPVRIQWMGKTITVDPEIHQNPSPALETQTQAPTPALSQEPHTESPATSKPLKSKRGDSQKDVQGLPGVFGNKDGE